MDEKLQTQLIKQLKIMNFWITLYGTLLLVVLVFILYMIFQVVTFVQRTNDQINSLKNSASDSVNVQKNVCKGDSQFSKYLKNNTDFCK